MPVPRVSPIYNAVRFSHIQHKDEPEKLLAFVIRRLYNIDRIDEFLTHNQFCRTVFEGTENEVGKYIYILDINFGDYIEHRGVRKRFNITEIYEDRPHIWHGNNEIIASDFKEQILSAINSEIRSASRNSRKKKLNIDAITKESEKNGLLIYSAIIDNPYDDFLNFDEGQQIRIFFPDGKRLIATILKYEAMNDTLYFQSNYKIEKKSGQIIYSNISGLFNLKSRIESFDFKSPNLINKLLSKNFTPENVKYENKIWHDSLDESQKNAILKSIGNDITFIWGPPGTGKSHTLGRLLLNLYQNNEKTLVCSIANVAVDNLLLKTVEAVGEYQRKNRIDLLSERRMVRLGYAQSDQVREIKEIQLEDSALELITHKLQVLSENLAEIRESGVIETSEEELNILSERDKLKRDYDLMVKQLIDKAKLVFMTAAKFINQDIFKEFEFDNLVIDEGSMMSIPSLIALGVNVKKRIIICGDFKQLGPIALSPSKEAIKWLKNDLFSLLGNESQIYNHSSLVMLKEQRRCAKDIASLFNDEFYNGKLITQNQLKHSYARDLIEPFGHVSFIVKHGDENNKPLFSQNKSRYNPVSRDLVWKAIELINNKSSLIKKVGIITPYKQQELDYKKEYSTKGKFSFDLMVGTIHTFQGSECDIIFWDITDTSTEKIGSLYRSDTGERLVNVAISRAVSRLIIVGDNRVFHEANGREVVSGKLRNILTKAYKMANDN